MFIDYAYNPHVHHLLSDYCVSGTAKNLVIHDLTLSWKQHVKHVLLSPFQLWDNWGSERLGDLSRITQLVRGGAIGSPGHRGRARIPTLALCPQPLLPQHPPHFTHSRQQILKDGNLLFLSPFALSCFGIPWGNSEIRVILQTI